ncbi:aminotransferase class V-fold PLP-dependent enzyme [bacterium]|nr:aminotransferase class V-fold PLP-dependent enzyme [bacterium]
MNISRRGFLGTLAGGAAMTALNWEMAEAASMLNTNPEKALEILDQAANDENYWKIVRDWFPLKRDKVYMNNGALGPSTYYVANKMHEQTLYWETEGEHGHGEMHHFHEKMAKFFGADVDEVAITLSTTDSMNMIARGLPLKKGDEVLMSTHEHPGGWQPWGGMVNDVGIKVNLYEPGYTAAETLNRIESALTPRTRVIMMSHISCTLGQIFPVKEVGELCRARDIFYVLDGAHPPGMIPLNFHDLECDFYAGSGHKWLLGPKGTGVLYVSKKMLDVWKPTYVGAYSGTEGDSLEKGAYFRHAKMASSVEYGTRNTPLAMGMGAAMDFQDAIGREKIANRGRALATYLRNKLKTEMPDIEILTPEEERSYASILTFKSPKMGFHELQEALSENAHIRLRGIHEHQLNAIRCSLHIYNNYNEVDFLVDEMKKVLA